MSEVVRISPPHWKQARLIEIREIVLTVGPDVLKMQIGERVDMDGCQRGRRYGLLHRRGVIVVRA
jgi:hypothetical protein